MEVPNSGNKDSNVLKLEDIRKKNRKSTTTTKSQSRAAKDDEKYILSADSVNDSRPPDNVEHIRSRSKPDPVEQEVETEVIKTPAKRSLVSNRRFDKAKVERIKAELADGSYEIDYPRLADKFIDHERFG